MVSILNYLLTNNRLTYELQSTKIRNIACSILKITICKKYISVFRTYSLQVTLAQANMLHMQNSGLMGYLVLQIIE